MYKERLFERIKHLDIDPERRRTSPDRETEVTSILAHINHLLTTRKGSTLIADDYGITDLSNYRDDYFNEYIRLLEKDIEETICKYEPRLDNVSIKFDGKDDRSMEFAFSISAELKNSRSPVAFETVVYPEGKVSVHEE